MVKLNSISFSIEQFEENVRVNWHSSKHPHHFLTSLLLLQQLSLPRDIATITLCSYILSHRFYIFSSKDFPAHFRLDCDLEQLGWQNVLQFSGIPFAKLNKSRLMHQEGKRIDWVSIQMKHYESNVCNFVPVLLVVQTCVSLGE